MKTLEHNQFLKQIANHLPYSPDSANYSLYESFIEIAETNKETNPTELAFELSKQVTLNHIEDWDNDKSELEIYNEILQIG